MKHLQEYNKYKVNEGWFSTNKKVEDLPYKYIDMTDIMSSFLEGMPFPKGVYLYFTTHLIGKKIKIRGDERTYGKSSFTIFKKTHEFVLDSIKPATKPSRFMGLDPNLYTYFLRSTDGNVYESSYYDLLDVRLHVKNDILHKDIDPYSEEDWEE